MLALLAPVPADILASGLELKNASGMVAFGTGAITEEKSGAWSFEFFSNPDVDGAKGHLPVLIYGSATGLKQPNPLHRPGFVTAVATYQGFQTAIKGEHPQPELRPEAALEGDWDYSMFWHVSKLRVLEKAKQLPLAKLKLPGTGKLRAYAGIAPKGPLLVWIPEALLEALE